MTTSETIAHGNPKQGPQLVSLSHLGDLLSVEGIKKTLTHMQTGGRKHKKSHKSKTHKNKKLRKHKNSKKAKKSHKNNKKTIKAKKSHKKHNKSRKH